jgi:hypothetical protein
MSTYTFIGTFGGEEALKDTEASYAKVSEYMACICKEGVDVPECAVECTTVTFLRDLNEHGVSLLEDTYLGVSYSSYAKLNT